MRPWGESRLRFSSFLYEKSACIVSSILFDCFFHELSYSHLLLSYVLYLFHTRAQICGGQLSFATDLYVWIQAHCVHVVVWKRVQRKDGEKSRQGPNMMSAFAADGADERASGCEGRRAGSNLRGAACEEEQEQEEEEQEEEEEEEEEGEVASGGGEYKGGEDNAARVVHRTDDSERIPAWSRAFEPARTRSRSNARPSSSDASDDPGQPRMNVFAGETPRGLLSQLLRGRGDGDLRERTWGPAAAGGIRTSDAPEDAPEGVSLGGVAARVPAAMWATGESSDVRSPLLFGITGESDDEMVDIEGIPSELIRSPGESSELRVASALWSDDHLGRGGGSLERGGESASMSLPSKTKKKLLTLEMPLGVYGRGQRGSAVCVPAQSLDIPLNERRADVNVNVARGTPRIGWGVLAGAVLSLSCIGAVVDFMHVSPLILCVWRAESCLIVMLPWAAWSYHAHGLRAAKDPKVFITMCAAALSWSVWFCGFFWGLVKTSLAHAYLLSNSTPVVIVCYNLVTGSEPALSVDVAGVAVAIAGAALCAWDSGRRSEAENDGGKGGVKQPTLLGDIVVILCLPFGAAFLILARKIRDKVELAHYMYLQMLINLPLTLILAVVFETISFAHPLDPHVGVVGWSTSQQIGPQLYIVVFGTIFGVAGYVAALKYLSSTVVAVAMLMEPILGALLGWGVGFNAFPSWPTLIGMCMVTAATLLISLHAGRRRMCTVDVPGQPDSRTERRRLTGHVAGR